MTKQVSKIDYKEWINKDTQTETLKDKVWQWVKGGYRCMVCQKKVSGRIMFNQWKKYHRFLCPECEIIEQMKTGEYENIKSHKE